MPKYTNKSTGQTFNSPRELSPEELEELFAKAGRGPEPEENPFQRFTRLSQEQAKSGDIIPGVLNRLRATIAAPMIPIQYGLDALRSGGITGNVPYIGAANKAVGGVLANAIEGVGGLLSSGGELVSDALFQNGNLRIPSISPTGLPAATIPLKPETFEAAKGLTSDVAAIGLGYGVPKVVSKAISAPIRALGERLPAEHFFQDAGNLGRQTAPSLERLDATIARGLKERIPFGGSFKEQRANLGRVQGTLDKIIHQEITPKIKQLTQSGVKAKTIDVAKDARAFLETQNKDLTGAQKVKFGKVLDKLERDFVKGEGAELTPERMQRMKTSIHQKNVYDEAGAFAAEWEKAIARQLRTRLETWEPSLKDANKRYADIAPIRNSIFEEIFKFGDTTPVGFSSAPLSAGPHSRRCL